MTFQEISAIEPRLQEMLEEAQQLKQDVDNGQYYTWCGNEFWYGYGGVRSLKSELVTLVGWRASNPQLKSTEAYDVAYQTIYDALPDCPGDCNASKNDGREYCNCVHLSELFKAFKHYKLIQRNGQ